MLSTARAARPPVPAWGAERIVRAVLEGQTDWRVAAAFDVSVSTVRTLVKVHRETGEHREPQQGKGRRDDPRWIFAGPYPEPCSVVVLDNCPNVHTQRAILTMAQDVGARIEFLEAYDPHHMPIEIAFRSAKDTLRYKREALEHLPRRERLRSALMRVGRDAARSAFHECGYLVPPDA
jgi:hypothetical protein